MRMNNALLTLVAMWFWNTKSEAASTTFKLCGRNLSDTMSRVCQQYNSPMWEDSAEEQPARVGQRRRRQIGIADECCIDGCSWEQLTYYCAISRNSETTLDVLESHLIENRSAEAGTEVAAPATARRSSGEVGRGRRRGYGAQGARGARRGGCWCRRRRTPRRPSSLMGNMDPVRDVERAAPVVGTVSPLLMWGRTLHAELPPPPLEPSRYAYIATYARPDTATD